MSYPDSVIHCRKENKFYFIIKERVEVLYVLAEVDVKAKGIKLCHPQITENVSQIAINQSYNREILRPN